MALMVVLAAVVIVCVLDGLVTVAFVVRMACVSGRFAIGGVMVVIVMGLMCFVRLAVGLLLGVVVILVDTVVVAMGLMVVMLRVALLVSARRRLRSVIVLASLWVRLTRVLPVDSGRQPDGEQGRQPGLGASGVRQLVGDASHH